MASFEFLAIILTGLGLTASILYYTMTLRNSNKTRQAHAIGIAHARRGNKKQNKKTQNKKGKRENKKDAEKTKNRLNR